RRALHAGRLPCAARDDRGVRPQTRNALTGGNWAIGISGGSGDKSAVLRQEAAGPDALADERPGKLRQNRSYIELAIMCRSIIIRTLFSAAAPALQTTFIRAAPAGSPDWKLIAPTTDFDPRDSS